MSAPPLPEIFGNYVLGDFVEVVSPAPISWLPQTTGWLCLGALALVLLLRYGWRRLRNWYRDRYRREAHQRLLELEQLSGQDNLLVELNRLLKLTALAAFSRQQVARLSGADWVDFLNSHCTSPPFSAEQRQLLAAGPYQGITLEGTARQQLFAACQRWIIEHQRAQDV